MTIDPRAVARSLAGEIVGCDILVPGPGHSGKDRSLSIKIDPTARDGFIFHSFAGDSPVDCRNYILAALGLKVSQDSYKQAQLGRARPNADAPVGSSLDRSALALRLWQEARDPRGTMVEGYLESRGLTLPDDVADGVVRFHPALKYNGSILGGMVALFRDIKTNTPCGVQRTFLDQDGRKVDRWMLGRAKQAAIKIDADDNVTMGLTIGEGFETSLAARLAGVRPVWAAGSKGSIAKFPVLAGVEAITILGEVGDRGANHRASQECANRWIEAGQEAFIVTPLLGNDLNDAWREVAP